MIVGSLVPHPESRQHQRSVRGDIFLRLRLPQLVDEEVGQRRVDVGRGIDAVGELAIRPDVDREQGRRAVVRARRRWCDQADIGRLLRIDAEHRAVPTRGGEHQQAAGTIDRQVDRVERRVGDDRQPLGLGPAVDALKEAVDEEELAVGIHSPARDRVEAVGELLHARRHRHPGLGCGRGGCGRQVEARELPLADLLLPGHVLDRILEREFARAGEGAAALRVAARKAALGVHMDVAEADVAGVVELHRRIHRLDRPRHAIAVIVGEQDVARIVEFGGDRVDAVLHLLLRLGRQELPVLDVLEHNLGAVMMLGRKLVDMARRLGVGDVEARRRQRVRRP